MDIFFGPLFTILSYAGIAQGFFVVLLLNNKNIRGSRANLFLSVLLLAMSFSIIHILYAGKVFSHFTIQVYHLGDPTFFLIAPLLLFYTKEVAGQTVKISFRLLLHFIPFLSLIFFSIFFKLYPTPPSWIAHLDANQRAIYIVNWVAVFIQFSVYLYAIRKKMRAFDSTLKQEVSFTENVNISWIKFFMSIFMFINLVFFFIVLIVLHNGNTAWVNKTIPVIFSLTIFALGYKGILQREIFYHTSAEKQDATTPPAEVSAKEIDPELIIKLTTYMADRKPYLDSELTLSSMAKDLGISRSILSEVINEGMGDNFYNFINKYRVEEVKRLMLDPAMKNLNLLGIASEAGFKSKSTFNLIFKRFTGLTPTEYIKNTSR